MADKSAEEPPPKRATAAGIGVDSAGNPVKFDVVAYKHSWYMANRERIKIEQKAYVEANRERIKEQRRRFNQAHKEEKAERDRLYHLANREDRLSKMREYQMNNRDKINRHLAIKKATDIQHRLRITLRSRILVALGRNYKGGSAVRDLGCSIAELKIHLENQFSEGMSWDNHGRKGWHIDHRIPLDSFDLSDREQFLKACHYTNLQPLWSAENISKANKVLPK